MAMKTKLVTLGSRLKYHRKKNQLTQKVVAELIGGFIIGNFSI